MNGQSRDLDDADRFPVPEVDDGEVHVYVSVGHQQMMTAAMKPLGISFWQLTAGRPMHEAGGRLFVDVTDVLSSPATGAAFVEGFRRSDPLIGDALQTVLDRGILHLPEVAEAALPPGISPPPPGEAPDPAVVARLTARTEASLEAARHAIRGLSGEPLLDAIRSDLEELKELLRDPQSMQVIMAAMGATWWLNEHLAEWLGERNAADTLTLSAPGNVTSEMGLALMDVADAVRPHPEVVSFLEQADDDGFLDALRALPGGGGAAEAIAGFLDAHGMRGDGEIDITRPRWREHPLALVPAILANVRAFEDGAARRLVEEGRRLAAAKEQEVLERLRGLPDGEAKAEEAKRVIDRLRSCIGYREHPKYGIVSRYLVYKEALLAEAGRLVDAGVLDDPEDIWFLRFDELQEVVRSQQVDRALIRRRQEDLRRHESLVPPRVLISDGEALTGAYRRDDAPRGALVGLPVSAGVVDGRARVLRHMADADLEPGDILVTAHTDPSWSPLFLAVAGLVTEVGGQMTHGAVVAREYGLPAVVGVEHATRLIADGQRIRVNGTDGYVELLEP